MISQFFSLILPLFYLVRVSVVLTGRISVAEGHPSEEMRQQYQVEDERHGQQRVLARVVHGQRIGTVQQDLRRVLVHRTL